MWGTLRLHQLILVSRSSSRTLSCAAQGPASSQARNFLRRGNTAVRIERHFLSTQPATAAVAGQSRDDGGYSDGRSRRKLQSAFGAAKNIDERGRRLPAQTGSDFQGTLAKLDVDVKRSGRVGFSDFNHLLKQTKELSKIPSHAALLLIRCCGFLLAEISPSDRSKIADDLWNTLEKSCERLDISHYNALLKVHLENSHKFDPTSFLAAMDQKGLQPNRVTYQRMAAYYCQQGDIDGATKILEFMRAKDLPINESVFNVLIQGYARAGDMENARGVLDMMRSSQVDPSADTYRTLLEAYAEKGDLDQIQKTFSEAEKYNVTLSDADYLDVIQALASKGHTDHIPAVLEKLRKTPGFFHDAMNASLRLVDTGHADVGYRILSSLSIPRDINERSGFGVIFLRKLVRYGEPVEKIWHYAEDMRAKQLNPWAVERCLESALVIGRFDIAKEILVKMAQSGLNVRGHYFWPIFAAYGKDNDLKGVLELIATMTELGVPASLETLTDYVLPGLKSMSTTEIIEQFKTRFPQVGILNPLAVFHLDNGNIREATKLIQDYDIITNPTVVIAPLALAYQKSKDFPAVEAFLRHLQKQSAPQANMFDAPGQFLVQVIQGARDEEMEIVELLKKMVKSGLKISNQAVGAIENRYRGRIPASFGQLLDRLTGPEGSLRFDDEFGKHPRNMTVEELEDHLLELKSKHMNTRGVLRRLLVEHARLRNVDRVEAIKAELDAGGFEYSAGMYAQLLDMYSQAGDLEKALAVKDKAQSLDPSFVTDGYKLLNLATLLVTKDRLEEAFSLLDTFQRSEKVLDFDAVERNIYRLLNAAAEKGDEAGVRKLWDKVATFDKFNPTNLICGPLVKVHFGKNNVPEALNAFNECVDRYKTTPWKGELMRRLVELEDTVSLQAVMDASIKVHGETNSLYDLAFAFIEAGRTKQAQKIFETPGMRARQDRLDRFAERVIERSSADQMEALLTATRDIFDVDRDALYYHLIRLYGKLGNPDKALAAWITMQEESLQASPRTLRALAAVLREHKREVPFAVPNEVQSQEESGTPDEIRLLGLVREDSLDEAINLKREMDNREQRLSIRGYSNLIELLLQKERVKEAVSLTRELLERGEHPFPAVTKFLVAKLNKAGDVSTLEELGNQFSDKLATFLALDKHLFMAHVNSNRSEDIVSFYEGNPNLRPPASGLLHLMRQQPQYQARVERLAELSAQRGDYRAVAAYWAYLFGDRKFDDSRKLLERYPALSANLRAFTICERAHENNDFELLRKLIDTLREHSRPNVALAYSYLIGLHCHNRDYPAALEVVKEVQNVAGLGLHELRLSALRVLDKGLQQMGLPVPFKIPEIQRASQELRPEQSQEFDEDSNGRMSRRQ